MPKLLFFQTVSKGKKSPSAPTQIHLVFRLGGLPNKTLSLTNGCAWGIFMLLLRPVLLRVVFIFFGITCTLCFCSQSKSLHQLGAGGNEMKEKCTCKAKLGQVCQ